MNDAPLKRKWDNELVRESELFYAKKEKAIEIAGRLKNLSYPVKDISTATGLSEDEIEKL